MQVRVLCDKAKEILMEESNVQVRLFFIIYVSMFRLYLFAFQFRDFSLN